MKSTAVRLTLLLMFVAAAGATAYIVWTSMKTVRAGQEAARGFETAAVAAGRAVLELRSTQQAYVAEGQGHDFWTARTSAALTDLQDRLAALRAQATAPRAHSAIDNATALLQDFTQTDRRAREYAGSGQKLLASDLIFSDGLEMTSGALASLDEARTAEAEARRATIADAERRQLIAVASCAGLALLLLVLLTPAPKAPAPEAAIPSVANAPAPAAPEPIDITLALDGEADNWNVPPRPAPAPAATEPAEAVTLGSIASLCTELARVVDTRSLSSILERTAAVLNASGIVLWIADPDGRELSPIVAHGYSNQLLARLGTLSRDAENATAAAFRTGLVQTVKGDTFSNGAIAAPLVTPTGTVGVMAAEVRNEGERQGAKLAAAAIVAAQLATLVGPPTSRVPTTTKAEIAGT